MRTKILMLITVAFLGIAGCADPCDDVNCLNGGVCNDGSCVCPNGFTGEFCQTEPDPCEDVTCENNGTCVDGTCNCEDGYEGMNCEQESRAKFLGSYNVSESCTSGNYSYNMTINTSGAGVQQVIINNLYEAGHNVVATVNGNNITIANQTLEGLTYSGSGQISGNLLTITFQISATGGSDTCTITATKQ